MLLKFSKIKGPTVVVLYSLALVKSVILFYKLFWLTSVQK